mgnify:FL=1
MVTAIEEGEYPQEDNEVMLSSNAKVILNVKIGDHVELQTPAGNKEVIISGFGSDDKQAYDGTVFPDRCIHAIWSVCISDGG